MIQIDAMIPRFIINNVTPTLLRKIVEGGYTVRDEVLNFITKPTPIMVFDKEILQAPDPGTKPLLHVFDAARGSELPLIQQQLDVQKSWSANMVKTELVLGEPKQGKVSVTPLGIIVDSFIIPIDTIRKIRDGYLKLDGTPIASHVLAVNQQRPFFTIGCADYSIEDFTAILAAHEKLLQPAS